MSELRERWSLFEFWVSRIMLEFRENFLSFQSFVHFKCKVYSELIIGEFHVSRVLTILECALSVLSVERMLKYKEKIWPSVCPGVGKTLSLCLPNVTRSLGSRKTSAWAPLVRDIIDLQPGNNDFSFPVPVMWSACICVLTVESIRKKKQGFRNDLKNGNLCLIAYQKCCLFI